MSDKSLSGLDVLWPALSLVGSNLDGLPSVPRDDTVDAARFVLAHGEEVVAQFGRELMELHAWARETGLTQRIERWLEERFDGSISPDLIVRAVEELATYGPGVFTSEASMDGPFSTLEISLSNALAEARGGPIPPRFAHVAEKIAPLRPDGQPWIGLTIGMGVGVSANGQQFQNGLLGRFYRHVAFCSQAQRWQDLREHLGFRVLDVALEFWPAGESARPTSVVLRGRRRVEVHVQRPVPPMLDPPSAVVQGDRWAAETMDEVFERIAAYPATAAMPRELPDSWWG